MALLTFRNLRSLIIVLLAFSALYVGFQWHVIQNIIQSVSNLQYQTNFNVQINTIGVTSEFDISTGNEITRSPSSDEGPWVDPNVGLASSPSSDEGPWVDPNLGLPGAPSSDEGPWVDPNALSSSSRRTSGKRRKKTLSSKTMEYPHKEHLANARSSKSRSSAKKHRKKRPILRDSVSAPLTMESASNVGVGYVTYGTSFADRHGLGNQMFNLAAVLYASEMSGRRPLIILEQGVQDFIERVFDLSMIEHSSHTSSMQWFHFVENCSLSYDRRVEELYLLYKANASRIIHLHGFYQSWKYTRLGKSTLLTYFKFKPNIRDFARTYLKTTRPAHWPSDGFVRVAIHIRRGDFLREDKVAFGYTVADAAYFQRAMQYFTSKYKRVQFIAIAIEAECQTWTKRNVFYKEVTSENSDVEVTMTYAFNHTYGQDMAIMAACDHVIISTGTFGWWGAWLANGTTIYYQNWPRWGTKLRQVFIREDFFPPHWIPM